MSDGVCTGFEPQNYLRDRCKKCFRLKTKHDLPTSISPTSLSSIMSSPENLSISPPNSLAAQKAERRRSWRDRNLDEYPETEIPDNMTETSSVISFKSARSKLISTARSMESISSIVDDRSMVTAASGSIEFDNDDRCITPTEISAFDLNQLSSENMRLQEQVNKLKEERKRWTLKRPRNFEAHQDETLVQILEDRLNEAEILIQDYRDENTSLKCELREITEGVKSKELNGKLRSAEDLCDELMVENEQLKNEVRDLQQEVEEMQDQYREEEIEEFRELQRELEQNAKNCRVLQFKLKKSERSKEQLKTENEVLSMKLSEQCKSTSHLHGDENDSDDNSVLSDSTVHSQSVRVRELESELRIAKEVSFRLHKELETAEEKRYKIEDEVFYYKEKLRELQTQSKWRDSRNRTEVSNQRRQSIELPEDLSNDDLRTLIEREGDLRDQLKFAEEDLKRTRNQMQELENENEELMQKLARLNDVSNTRNSLNKKPIATRNARILDDEINSVKKLQGLQSDYSNEKLNAEIEKDIKRLIEKIQELEKQNSELQVQIRKQIMNDNISSRNKATSVELRQERQQRKQLEAELTEYKQLIAKSDNAKLIAMATKVELLTNQLNMALERANAAHKKAVKESGAEENYVDQLKKKIEQLERQHSELLAKETFKIVNKYDVNSSTMPSADEIEHCCVVLASVEAQTTRICKQIDRLDNPQKEERRRSLSKESSAGIAVDLASIMAELKVIRQILKAHKDAEADINGDLKEGNGVSEEKIRECELCSEKNQNIETLKEEIVFYKKKNKELTNQVLQTEDRWTVEIEKQTYNYRTEIRQLQTELIDIKSRLKEQEEVANARMVTLVEKQKTIEEQSVKMNRLEHEINERKKIIQDYEKEQKTLKEFEIKYRKLEDMYQKEKEKYDTERSKIKSEMSTTKKKSEDLISEIEKIKLEMERKENIWNHEKQNLQNEINQLRKSLKKNEAKEGDKDEEEEEEEEEENVHVSARPVIRTINYRVTKINNEMGVPELKEKLVTQQQKYSDLEGRYNKLQIAKECLENEFNRLKDNMERERNDFQHRTRQNEKIRSFEMDALQQKFTSRMNIMENTNKSLHTQLVQIRRERDRFRDSMNTTESKLLNEQKHLDEERKTNSQLSNLNSDLENKMKSQNAEIDRLRHELKLKIDAHKTDCALWEIQRKHLEVNKSTLDMENKDVRITENALNAAEAVQKQYAEYQKFYTKEVARLNKCIKEMTSILTSKENEFSKKANQLDEQIKILEIDQKNLLQAKQVQLNATEVLRADQDRLMQIVQQSEIQKLTRKYKITAIIDRLRTIRNRCEDTEVTHIINQLSSMKEDDSNAEFISSDLHGYDVDSVLSSARTISSINASVYSTNPMFLPNQRSLSIESSSTWDSRFQDYTTRSVSPVKKMVNYPDPPPNFMLSKDTRVEYDRDGKLHYVPKTVSRCALYDNGGPVATKSTGTLTDDTDVDNDSITSHSRMGSSGTNILYKIRREELAKGTAPSVRTIAKAFETLDRPKTKRGFFNIRKSRSVDTSEDKPSVPVFLPPALTRNTTSMSRIEMDLPVSSLQTKSSSNNPVSHYGTITRGGRNPFKNMGTKLVDRVRRSLSKSGRISRDQTPERAPLAPNEDISPMEEMVPTAEEKAQTKTIKKMRVKKSADGEATKITRKKPTAV